MKIDSIIIPKGYPDKYLIISMPELSIFICICSDFAYQCACHFLDNIKILQ
jgi:hypothetical protein